MMAVAIRNHNCTVLNELRPGDNIEIDRGMYSHWAVYKGEGKVIHMTGADDDGINGNVNSASVFTICGKRFKKAFVKVDDFWDVVGDSKAYKNNGKDRKFSPCSVDEILDRALSMVGEVGYNVLWQNCEHFASYCRYGVSKSSQADTFFTWAAVASLIAGLGAIVIGSSRSSSRRTAKE
ncbi:Kelch-like protein 6 [Mactra antiquata]